MLNRFNNLTPVTRLIIVIILLIVAWMIIRIALGLLKMLLPLVILAAVIVVALWLFEKARKIV